MHFSCFTGPALSARHPNKPTGCDESPQDTLRTTLHRVSLHPALAAAPGTCSTSVSSEPARCWPASAAAASSSSLRSTSRGISEGQRGSPWLEPRRGLPELPQRDRMQTFEPWGRIPRPTKDRSRYSTTSLSQGPGSFRAIPIATGAFWTAEVPLRALQASGQELQRAHPIFTPSGFRVTA